MHNMKGVRYDKNKRRERRERSKKTDKQGGTIYYFTVCENTVSPFKLYHCICVLTDYKRLKMTIPRMHTCLR